MAARHHPAPPSLNRLRQTFLELVALAAPPGFEHDVRTYVTQILEGCDCDVEVDVMGSVIARLGHDPDQPTLLVSAHMDEIGMMITRIEENGFLRFRSLGAPVEILMPGNAVTVGPVSGIIGSRDFHTTPEDERGRVPRVAELFIDVGARSGDEARSFGVRVGSPVSYRGGVVPIGGSGEIVGSKSVDNRVACAIGLELLRRDRPTPAANLVVLFAVQEEVGFRGARIAMEGIRPDCAIVLDNALTEDTPFYPPPTPESVTIGGGPLLSLREEYTPALVGMIPHQGMVDWVRRAARGHGIPLQEGFLYPFGATDAVAIYDRHGGIPTVYIGVPSRYAHSPLELVDLRDLDATSDLVAALYGEATTRAWST